MRIAIFGVGGVGGVGGYFGGRLAQAGEDVVFIRPRKNLETLQTHGLKVESIKGDFVVNPVQASEDPNEVGVVDVVLVGVKSLASARGGTGYPCAGRSGNGCDPVAKWR